MLFYLCKTFQHYKSRDHMTRVLQPGFYDEVDGMLGSYVQEINVGDFFFETYNFTKRKIPVPTFRTDIVENWPAWVEKSG